MDLIWKPNKKQAEFLSLPDTIFEAMYGGAAGGGKSDALLMLPMVREFYKNPKFKALLLRRTYPELESELIVRSMNGIGSGGPSYKHFGGQYNQEKKRWTFPNGGMIQFGHIEYDSDVRKYDSAEYNYIGFDELTSFTEYQYTYLFSRCRSSSDNLPAFVRSGTNPGGVGHGWVRSRFVEPAPYGTIIVDKTTKLKRIFIQAKLTDNPHLMKNDPLYAQKLQLMPEKDRRAKADGDWWTFSGQVFDDYREQPFNDEPENARHVISAIDLPKWWPRFLAIDWGYSAMTAAYWAAMSPDDRLYVYREYTCKQTKISDWATTIGRLSHDERYSDIVMCQSAWQNRGEDSSIAEQFEFYSGLRPRLADNRRVAGKLLLQEYFRWRPKPDRKVIAAGYSTDVAQAILRQHGLEAYKEYLGSFEPEKPETNLPKVQIFEECVELRKAIPLCVYDDKNTEDVAEFPGDDPYDAFRYLVEAADRFRGTGKVEHEYHQQVAKAITRLESSNDMTSYYINMKRIESKGLVGNRPVKRFHRRVA